MKLGFGTNGVSLRRDFICDARMRDAYGRLLHDVLGPDIEPATSPGPWTPVAFFSSDGCCVAGLEVGLLPLVLDSETYLAGAIRSAATDPQWRGRSLFRRLMEVALEWCDVHSTSITMLYTETPSLYERFGFCPIRQHAFAGTVPVPFARSGGCRLALDKDEDRTLVSELVGRRAPVSARCALSVDAPLFLTNIAKNEEMMLLFDLSREILVAYEQDGDQIVIADVVASQMPTMAEVTAIIASASSHVKCLFPPDRVGWDGTPEETDAGLMVRGKIPPAMRRPFMLTPTSEF